MSQGSSSFDLIRLILDCDNSAMARQRYQDPPVKQSKNGTFYIRPWVDVVGPNGLERKKKVINLGPASMGARKALAEKNRVMTTINRADYLIKSQITFDALVKRFLDHHVKNLRQSTQDKYDSLIRNHLKDAFAGMQLYELGSFEIQKWLNSKQGKVSKATRFDLKNLLSGIFQRAIDWKLYNEANPVMSVIVHGEDDAREKRKLSDDDTRRLLGELRADVRLLCSIALFCTLRISEALGLQEKHLDFENGMILIRQAFVRGVLNPPKTKKSKRDIPMGALADALRPLRTGDPERFVFQIRTNPGRRRKDGSLPKERVCRDDRDIAQHFLRPAAKRLKIYWKGFGFHALRREAITSIIGEAGVGQAMNAAGHSKVDMSLLYTLDNKVEMEKAIRAHQERLLGKPEGPIQ